MEFIQTELTDPSEVHGELTSSDSVQHIQERFRVIPSSCLCKEYRRLDARAQVTSVWRSSEKPVQRSMKEHKTFAVLPVMRL